MEIRNIRLCVLWRDHLQEIRDRLSARRRLDNAHSVHSAITRALTFAYGHSAYAGVFKNLNRFIIAPPRIRDIGVSIINTGEAIVTQPLVHGAGFKHVIGTMNALAAVAIGYMSFHLANHFTRKRFMQQTWRPRYGFKTVKAPIGYWNTRGLFGRTVNEGLGFS